MALQQSVDFAKSRWSERSTKIALAVAIVGIVKLFVTPEVGALLDQLTIFLGVGGAVTPDKPKV